MNKIPLTEAVEQAQVQLNRAYANLICDHSFFASILMHLEKVMDPRCSTAWTDGRRIGFSPWFVLKLTLDQLIGVLCHEVLHVARLHPFRRGTRKPKPWNVACDKTVNQTVLDIPLELPKGFIPPCSVDQCAEEVYDESDDGGSGGGGGMPGADGDGEGEGEGDGGDDPGGCGEVRDATDEEGRQLVGAAKQIAEEDAKVMIQQALNTAKAKGDLPAGLERLIEDVLEPKVPWLEILSRFIDGNVRQDYTWMRPNKRYVSSGIVLPSLNSPGFGLLAFGTDASGSIDQVQLKEIASEIIACLELYVERGQDVELPVLWFDTKVYPQIITDASELKPKGGGGTSYAPVFKYVEDTGMIPRAIIMVTDGYCNDFGEQPDCAVLWILTQENKAFAPPFGEITCIMNQ